MSEKKLTGRIAADRIRMQSTPKPPAGAVERFLALGECTSLISDVMDELGISERRHRRQRAEADVARQVDLSARRSPCATSGSAPIRSQRHKPHQPHGRVRGA